MASMFTCDGGCGHLSDDLAEMTVIGLVRPGHYCQKCSKLVKKYEKDRDELHLKISQTWNSGLEELKEVWKRANPKGTLPDE